MKAFAVSTLTLILSLVAASASAQSGTEEARALAAHATAQHERDSWARPPVAEPVARGDYRGEAHQRERLAQWQASQRAVRAYETGARSQPLAVTSEESARAEAHRIVVEQELAQRATVLRSASASQ